MRILKWDIPYMILLFFILFLNAILSRIPLGVVNYFDEGIALILGVVFFTNLAVGGRRFLISKWDKVILKCVTMTYAVGIVGNILFAYTDSVNAILRDIVNFAKFPITYLAVRNLKFGRNLADFCTYRFGKFVRFTIAVIFTLACISLFVDIGMSQDEIRHGIRPFQFLFSHPTNMVMCSVLMLVLLENEKRQKGRNNTISILLCLCVIALAMRTKGFMIIALYVFIKYASGWVRRLKVLYWCCIAGVGFAAAYSKLQLVFSFSGSGRMSLYEGGVRIRPCSLMTIFTTRIGGKKVPNA